MTELALARARRGDEDAFRELSDPYRRELWPRDERQVVPPVLRPRSPFECGLQRADDRPKLVVADPDHDGTAMMCLAGLGPLATDPREVGDLRIGGGLGCDLVRTLIVDSGEGRGALAAVRGLRRGGWTVGVGTPARTVLPSLSRYTRHRHLVPALACGEASFLSGVERAVAARPYELVFACSDEEILTLSRTRRRIGAHLPYPPHEVMLQAIDKVHLAVAAQAAGIATPPFAWSGAEARERWGTGPAIVKERLHGTRTAAGTFTHFAPQSLTDPDEVDRRAQEIRAAGGIPIVQPRLQGRLMAFTSVIDQQGQIRARVQQVAERTYPRDAGLSVRARTVPVDEWLAGLVAHLLGQLSWSGLSELQFILPRDGPPVLLDFNGRFYGSLALALAAGVNLPDVWARVATGRPTPDLVEATPGVRYQWFEGDLRAARERSHGTLRDLAGCLRYARGASGSIRSLTDPLPGLFATGTFAGENVGRIFGRDGRRARGERRAVASTTDARR